MKKLLWILCLSIGVLAYGQDTSNYVKNEIIVKFKIDFNDSNEIEKRFEKTGLSQLNTKVQVSEFQVIKNKKSTSTLLITFDNNEFSVTEVALMYQNTGLFDYVEPNYKTAGSGVMNTTPNDAVYNKQWALKNDGTFSNATATIGADIEMELAWDLGTGDSNMIVAVIDSGLRLTHPEFAGRLWNNPNEVADGTDTDNNGFVDDLVAGWDFINSDNDPTDDHGHGTNVAGIALATGDNSIGFAGVNWRSKVMICKALNSSNNGSYAAMAGSIYYAVDNGAKVISMSIGGSGNSTTISDAIDYCYNNGVILVACMMNFDNGVTYYPAAYDKTIAVGATDSDDTRSSPFFWSATSGSNFGSHIDLVAPGNYMYGLSSTSDTNYSSYWGGTSQATPLVSGVISLLLAQNPNLTFEEIRTILHESSEDQIGDAAEDVNGFDIYYGHGRLNANNALTHNLLSVNNFDINENQISITPNPVTNDSSLTLSNLNSGEEYSISVYNVLGQKILTNNIININSESIVTLSGLNNGAYFLKIINTTKNSSTVKKLIVK